MSNLLNGLSSDAMVQLAIDVGLTGFVFAVLAASLYLVSQKRSAALRHLVLTLACIGLVSLPWLSVTLPALPVVSLTLAPEVVTPPNAREIFNDRSDEFVSALVEMETVESIPVEKSAPIAKLEAPRSVPAPPKISSPADLVVQDEAAPGVAPAVVVTPVAPVVQSHPPPAFSPNNQAVTTSFVASDVIRLLPYIWLLGAAISLLMPLVGLLGIAHLDRTSRPVVDTLWLELLHTLQAKLGVNRRVKLLRADNVDTAITWSVFRPKLLLPASADSWSESKRRAVLLHELAHIQRFDWAVQMLTHLACALHWFNPLVWWMSRRMHVDREQASDDVVLSIGISPVDYASQLVEIATRIRPHLSLAAIPMAQHTTLRQRVSAILDPKRPRDAVGRIALIGAFIVCCCIAVPVSMLKANATQADEQEPSEALQDTTSEEELGSPPINDSGEETANVDPPTVLESLPKKGPAVQQVALSTELVQAWEEARAEVWWRRVPGNDIFEYKADGSRGISAYSYTGIQPTPPVGYHPSFILPSWRAGVVSQLPVPEIPFELRLHKTNVSDEGLKELSRMTNLQLLTLADTELTDAGLKELVPLAELRSLDLSSTRVSDDALKPFSGLKNLQHLNLSYTLVSGSGLVHLGRPENLRSLELGYSPLSSEGLKGLRGMTGLVYLDVSSYRLTDAGMKAIAGLTNLRTLRLNSSRVTGVGLKELKALTNLRVLNLEHTKLSDEGLRELTGHTNLESLTLNSTKVTDKGLEILASLKNLKSLHVQSTKVSYEGVKQLQAALPDCEFHPSANDFERDAAKTATKLESAKSKGPIEVAMSSTKLHPNNSKVERVSDLRFLKERTEFEALHLSGPTLKASDLEILKALTNVKYLSLSGSQVTNAGLVHLKGLTELRELKLNDTSVTNAGLKHLSTLTNLEKLELQYTQITSISNLSGLTRLSGLNLRGSPVNSAGLAHLEGLPNLGSLDLSMTDVSDVGLESLVKMAKLGIINLSHTLITDEGLAHLKGLKNAKQLSLSNSRKVTREGVIDLKQALPDCDIALPHKKKTLEPRDELGWQIDTPLNKRNLNKILDNPGKFTASDLVEMLGPPTPLTAGQDFLPSRDSDASQMTWEDVSRIEVTFRDKVVAKVSGTFSPRLKSTVINESTLEKISLGMTLMQVYDSSGLLTFRSRWVHDAKNKTATLVAEQYNQFRVALNDGKAVAILQITMRNDPAVK